MIPARTLRPLLALSLILAATSAEARTALSGGPFGNGLTEAFLILEHLAGLLAIGLWAGQIGGSAAWHVPVAAVAGALVAGLAANLGLPLPRASFGLALAVIASGVLAATAWRPAPLIALPIAAVIGVFHGYMSGGSWLFWSGYGVGMLLVAAAGFGLETILSQGVSPRAVRVCGGGAALVGILDLAGRF